MMSMIPSQPGSESIGRRPAWLALLLLAALLQGCLDTVTPAAATTVPFPSTAVQTASVPDPTETAMPPSLQRGGNADVLHVRAVQAADGSWTFFVTVTHADTGWDDYADGWDVVTPDGHVLKPDPDGAFTRTLTHPHEDEQPFTRSQANILIPAGVTQVRVRAHDLVDGFGGRQVVVDLTSSTGLDFEVERP